MATLVGDGGNNSLSSNATGDSISGLGGNDSLTGGGGHTTLTGGDGNDFLYVGNHSVDNSLQGDDGNDFLEAGFGTDNNTLNGGNGDDLLEIWQDLNVLGTHQLIGGPGNDRYLLNGTYWVATIFEAVGEGTDTVVTSGSYTLPANVECLVANGGSFLGAGNGLDNFISGTSQGLAADTLLGLGGNDSLDGADGNDTLSGDDGNDSLIGGKGNDTLDGGADSDTVVFSGTRANYIILRNGATFTVQDGRVGVPDGTDQVTNVEFFQFADGTFTADSLPGPIIVGSSSANLIDGTHTMPGQPLPTAAEDNIYGNGGNDTINALGGDDTIDGGTNSDSMIGGPGNDLYVVDAAGDKVLENANEGTDIVHASVSYTLPSNVEALILTGGATLNGTGNSGDNSITGNGGNNILAGLGGADALDGDAGIDTATYAASSSGVDVSLAMGIGSGGDAAGDTLIHIENLTGSNLNDTLEGDSGDNVLTGGSGNDMLSYQHADAGVTVNLSITSAQNTIGAGTDTVTKFEDLTGSAFDNSLTGSTANNVLMGLAGNDTLSDNGGNDTLDGGTGADAMAGGTGNDVYVVDNAGDVVNELSGGGTDTIQTVLNSYSLAPVANVENLTFIGAGAFTGTGNGLNNALTGGSGNDTIDGGTGNDTLDGGAGADSMIGGAGNDTFIVDDGGDAVTDSAGTITVKTTLATYTLGANLESLTFTGAGNFAGTGNTLANTITGGAGNDTLDGGSGNDKLTGGAGADTLTGGAGADKFVFANLSDFASGPTFDTITDFTHAQTDKIDLSAIDGNANIAKSAFTFIGAAAFSNVAGQLHYVVNGSGGVNVEGDTNGDGVADFTLVVNGVASLVGNDFVL